MAALLLLLVGFGGDGKQDQFRQLTRDEAIALTVRAAKTERDPVEVADLWARRGRALVGTWKSRNSVGGEAWLSIFRLTGVENDPDQACIWVWRATVPPDPHGFEEVPSVAWGRSGAIHDRCWAEVRKRGIAPPDQAMASEISPQPVASPDVVGPFGSRPAGLYPLEYSGGDAMTLTGMQLDLPVGMTAGSCGLAGFVIDAKSERLVPRATVSVATSHPWSGISDKAEPWPHGALSTVSDRFGAFAVGELPVSDQGFDVGITAPGYAPAREVHEDCAAGDWIIADWPIDHEPTFEDATPYPVGR